MPEPTKTHETGVVTFLGNGPLVDAGGWYVGADGKLHHVGPWNPETLPVGLRDVVVGLHIHELASHITNAELRAGIQKYAHEAVAAGATARIHANATATRTH